MLIVLLLLTIRIIPFEASVFLCRIAFHLFFMLSPQSKRQLIRAKETLGKNRFPTNLYIKKLAFNVAIMIRIGTSLTKKLIENARFEGVEHLEALRDSHGSAVVGTFHFGPWELIAEIFTVRGYKLAALVTRRSTRIVDRCMSALRHRAGLKIVHNLNNATALTKEGFFLASLFDRTIRGKSNHMNFPYSDYQTSRLPFILAARVRSPILPVTVRFVDRKLEVWIGKPTRDTGEIRDFFTPFFTQTPYEWLAWGD